MTIVLVVAVIGAIVVAFLGGIVVGLRFNPDTDRMTWVESHEASIYPTYDPGWGGGWGAASPDGAVKFARNPRLAIDMMRFPWMKPEAR